ncbi:MAG: energy-coupling factor transporter transmembrane protein EcfT [Chloroflexi bacterium]|nr:energy-coupling factor transporter transmembrane protein EcfT [Chloroflexota bacterium]
MRKIAYFPAHSTLHALHPFTKFILLLGIGIMIFFIQSALLQLVLLVLLFLSFLLIKQNPFRYHGMRVTLVTAFTLALIQCLFYREGTALLQIHGWALTDMGLQRAVIISCRFVIIILCSYVFILTTSPSDLAYAFMQIGIPYRYAFMIVTSMRLVPILSIEGERIMHAQRLRGAHYSIRKPATNLYHLTTFLNAVLFSLVNRVDRLAISMEGRSFGRYPKRTYRNLLQFKTPDVLSLVLVPAILILFISMKGII